MDHAGLRAVARRRHRCDVRTAGRVFRRLFAPTRRYSGFAFARELGSVLAGGPAPFVATALVAWAGGSWWPVALYIVLLSGVTAFAVWCGPETYRDDISMDASEPALKT